ncbi:MAG TPA: RluA family pseudouridine synthase [Candidatus Acidoferrum sp.]
MPSGNNSSRQEFVVPPSDAGHRLDSVVAAHCTDLSRTRAQELIDAGLILVNGRSAKGAHRLHGGELITVDAPQRPPILAEAESIPLDILYEDDDVIAVNKSAGMIVHAGAGNLRGTLVNALLGRGQSLSQGGDPLRPGIVHRLDKDTSGVILVAKNDAAHAKLGDAFRLRTVKKVYVALVEGILPEPRGSIDSAIGRDPKNRLRMTARRSLVFAKAREARTDWRVLARIGPTTLAEVQLHTGRTHQIRVHFSAIGHPVVGDKLYGASPQLQVGEATLPPLDRNFLHAVRLEFAQPRTAEKITVIAPLPETLRNFLGALASAAKDDPRRIDATLAPYL